MNHGALSARGLAGRREYPCQVQDIFPGSAALIASVFGKIGERLVAYLECIGRLEETITRRFSQWLRNENSATAHKRDKLAAQLTWLRARVLRSASAS
jgi:hypothetical protein